MKKILVLPIFCGVLILSGCDNAEKENEANKKMEEMQTLVEQQKSEIDDLREKVQEMEDDNVEEEVEEENVSVENNDGVTEEEARQIARDEAYCQNNANSYSLDNYNRLKKEPKEMKEKCEEMNEVIKDLCEKIESKCDDEKDCEKVYKNNMKEVESYKLKYDEYHQKCD